MDNDTINIQKKLDNSTDIDAFLKENMDAFNLKDFHSYLTDLLTQSDMSVKNIIDLTYIDRHYCYQIFRGVRLPKRNKILQIAFAMSLDIDKTNRLLKLSNQAPLYVKDLRDAIITFALKNNKTLDQVEQLLIDKNIETISL